MNFFIIPGEIGDICKGTGFRYDPAFFKKKYEIS
jgi:hypothetical protein